MFRTVGEATGKEAVVTYSLASLFPRPLHSYIRSPLSLAYTALNWKTISLPHLLKRATQRTHIIIITNI